MERSMKMGAGRPAKYPWNEMLRGERVMYEGRYIEGARGMVYRMNRRMRKEGKKFKAQVGKAGRLWIVRMT
jgi:hypothetical protein